MPPIPPLSLAAQQFVEGIRNHTPTLKIECEDHIRGLVQFLAEDNEEYCEGMRGFHFAIGAIDGDVAGMLQYCIDTWGKLMPLESLTFDEAEALLQPDPHLVKAFAELTTVKHLHMENVGRAACEVLLEMKSSLLTAELSFSMDPVCSPDDVYYSDPIYLLAASLDTLEELKATDATTGIAEGYHHLQYPHMHTLELAFVDVPHTYDYVVAFPNLKHLTISSYLHYLGGDLASKCAAYRGANQKEQDEYGSWTELAQVSGPLRDVYVLGLRCSVCTLELDATSEIEEDKGSMLRAIIEDTEPENVKLTTDPDFIIDEGLLHIGLCGEKIRNFKFTRLEIMVKVDRDMPAHRVRDTVAYTVRALHKLWIEKLRFCFDVKVPFDVETDAGADAYKRSYLGSMNLKVHGASMIGGIERLNTVSIFVEGLRRGECAYAALCAVPRTRTIEMSVPEGQGNSRIPTGSEVDHDQDMDSEDEDDDDDDEEGEDDQDDQDVEDDEDEDDEDDEEEDGYRHGLERRKDAGFSEGTSEASASSGETIATDSEENDDAYVREESVEL